MNSNAVASPCLFVTARRALTHSRKQPVLGGSGAGTEAKLGVSVLSTVFNDGRRCMLRVTAPSFFCWGGLW